MKYAQVLALLVIGSQASPILDSRNALDTSLSTYKAPLDTAQLDDSLKVLEKRINPQTCKRVLKNLWKFAGTSTMAVLTYKGIDLAKTMCDGDENCEKHTEWVRQGMEIVLLGIGFWQHGVVSAGPQGTEQNTELGAVRRSIDSGVDFGEMMGDNLRSHGFAFDRLESVDVSDWPLEKRGSGPRLSHRYIVHSFKHSQHEDYSDVIIDHFDDDGYNLHMAPSCGNGTEATLGKRYDSEGIKIAWTSRGSHPFDSMDGGEVYQFSQSISRDWRDRVIRDGISQYFGLVETNHAAGVYYRIIGETGGFGNDYESVNDCGGMGEFL